MTSIIFNALHNTFWFPSQQFVVIRRKLASFGELVIWLIKLTASLRVKPSSGTKQGVLRHVELSIGTELQKSFRTKSGKNDKSINDTAKTKNFLKSRTLSNPEIEWGIYSRFPKVKIVKVTISTTSVHTHNAQHQSLVTPAYKGRWLHLMVNS